MPPLTFITDMPSLQARLRLSAVTTGDAAAVLASAIEETRLMLFAELGADRVAEIQAIVPAAAPTTDDELDRLRAENVEMLHIRLILLQRLPSLFVQSGGQVRDAWNDEGITRKPSDEEHRRELRVLTQAVRQGIAYLAGTHPGEVRATVPLPDVAPQLPGASIKPVWVRA